MQAVTTPEALGKRLAFLIGKYGMVYEKELAVSARQLSLAAGLHPSELSNTLDRLQNRKGSKGILVAKWAAIGDAAGADPEWWFCDTKCENPVDDSPRRRAHIQKLAAKADREAKGAPRLAAKVNPDGNGVDLDASEDIGD